MITPIETFEEELISIGKKKYLQPMTYKISPDHLKQCEVIALYMPDKWTELTRDVFYKKKWQLMGIMKLMLEKHPYIFHYSLTSSSYVGEKPFLYIAKEYYSVNVMDSVAMDLMILLKDSNRRYQWGIDNSVLHSFLLDPKMEKKSLYEIVTSDMGSFQIISGYFTHQLCKKPITLALELYYYDYSTGEREQKEEQFNGTLQFSHSVTNSKHEAISNIVEVAGGYSSLVFTLGFVEFVGQEGWYINLKTSVRQWIVSPEPTKYKNLKEQASVYIGSLFKDETKENVLIHTTLKAKQSEDNQFFYEMPTIHEDVLKNHHITIIDILNNTRHYVENGNVKDKLFIGVPYSYANASWWEGYRSFQLTGNGIALEEDRNFYYELSRVLKGLEVIPGIMDVSSKKFKVKEKETSKKIPFSQMTIPNNINLLTINIFSADPSHYEDIKKILFHEIYDNNLPAGVEKFPFRNAEETNIQFQNKILPVFIKYKSIKNAHQLYAEDFEKKVQDVYEEVANDLQQDSCINLFFLPDYQKLTKPGKLDPYQAIRQAFGRHGHHVQFINYRFGDPSKTYHPDRNLDNPNNKLQRYRHAFLDCLSKQGITQSFVTPVEESILEIGIMEERVFGRNVLFMTKQQDNQISIKIAGITQWILYDKAAGLFDTLKYFKRSVPKIEESFILENIMREVSSFEGEVLLYLPANLRMKISWLKNTKFSSATNPIAHLSNVHIIRYNNWDDVPSYFTRAYKNQKWSNSQPKGLFALNQTSFLSLADRGDQIRSQLGKSRFTAEEEINYKRKRLVEFSIINGKRFTREELANYAHESRRRNISYDSFTNLPQTLYWIQQLVEDFK
ncbi:hypothetical protein LG307_20335 [Sutcliffiella horikoshii]|uniref:RNaseH domain-containing protein n=1 Tax=Sutcliffiella horikoshii TaxID=79883 RepID=UPI00384D35B1